MAPEGRGTAVIINEYGAVGIDDALVRGTADEVTLLGNGCLCCTTRSDLELTLRRLLRDVPQELSEIAAYYFVDHMNQDEIASILGVSRRTVGNRIEEFRQAARAAGEAA